MRRAALHKRPITLVIAVVAVALVVTSAAASPLATDVAVLVVAGPDLQDARPRANGSTTIIAKLAFKAGMEVDLVGLDATSAKARLTLAAGLRFGADGPDPTEACTASTPGGECTTAELLPITGRNGTGWVWDVVADRAGTYQLTAELIEATPPDADATNDRAAITVVVTEPSTGGGGSGGGSGTLVAGAVKVSPSRPKAGARVSASVRVTVGGAPVKPTGVACAATIAGSKLSGKPRAASGTATCTYRPAAAAQGKVLRGSITFSATGKRLTRRFATRLG